MTDDALSPLKVLCVQNGQGKWEHMGSFKCYMQVMKRHISFISTSELIHTWNEENKLKVGSAMITHVRYGQNQAQSFTSSFRYS